MKESQRKRIEQSLQLIEQWRASGQTLQSFAQQHGQTLRSGSANLNR